MISYLSTTETKSLKIEKLDFSQFTTNLSSMVMAMINKS